MIREEKARFTSVGDNGERTRESAGEERERRDAQQDAVSIYARAWTRGGALDATHSFTTKNGSSMAAISATRRPISAEEKKKSCAHARARTRTPRKRGAAERGGGGKEREREAEVGEHVTWTQPRCNGESGVIASRIQGPAALPSALACLACP